MSTLKNQESIPDNELTELRKQANNKDIRYATLENELLKRNNDLTVVKGTLDEALYKLRKEADRAVKLEEDLNRRSEDLRAERLARQNLEASLQSASVKLKSEESTSKHWELELETYASRIASQHEGELKHLQHEKTLLEARVRSLESQAQVNKPSQLPTRLPRPTTFSGAAATASDARVATLESELSKVKNELADQSQTLSHVQQEAAKVPHLQSKLIAAENAQMRAERLATSEKVRADGAQGSLRDCEEELEYWRNTAQEISVMQGKMEDAITERDDAIRREGEIRWLEAALRKKVEEMEEKEAGLVMEREEALNELHRLQAESNSSASGKVEDGPTMEDLRPSLAERDAALLNARGYATELQQMYRDTLNACEIAEARVRELEEQYTSQKDNTPLIIVSPPASPSPAAPFLAQAQPAATLSAADEAIIARLLNAIERLRSERNALRRDLHFAHLEHKMAADALQAQLAATESEVQRLAQVSQTCQDEIRTGNEAEIQKMKHELDRLYQRVSETDEALVARTVDLDTCNMELESVRLQVRSPEDTAEHTRSSIKDARIALSALVVVQQLQLHLDDEKMSNEALSQECSNLVTLRNHLAEAHERAESSLLDAVQARDSSLSTQELLRGELASSNARVSEALQVAQDSESHVADLQAQMAQLREAHSDLEQELVDARAELSATEARHAAQQLSDLSSADTGAANALKAQLEVLEQRVLRRTEQIGMQQHDIKRLETNLRVAEDTIGELNAELDTLGQEKACLVEDCGQAREARDEAHKRVEALEVECETFVREHEELVELRCMLQEAQGEVAASEARIEALVRVVADSGAKTRLVNADLAQTVARLATAEADFHAVKVIHSQATAEVERLALELDDKALMLNTKAADMEAIAHELSLAKDEIQRVSNAFESFQHDVQSREENISSQKSHLTATVQELEERLVAAQTSGTVLSEALVAARQTETTLKLQLVQVQEDSKAVAARAEKLSLTITSLEEAVEAGRLAHSEDLDRARKECEARVGALEAQLEALRMEHVSLEAKHAEVIRDFTVKSEQLQARLADAHTAKTMRQSLEGDLQRLKTEHADEILVLQSRLDESAGEIESLQEQLNTASETIQEFESDLETATQRYEAAQVEIRGLELALTGARAQLDEHDTSIQALQREKTLLQGEATRLEAEVEKSMTKYQYLEQDARRGDQEILRLKKDIGHLQAEAAKFDEAAQKAEVSLSFKTVQFEQQLAILQRELKRQQEHRQCQESISELTEKNEYLEEMLRMKSVEIEENDDRFIEALKEKKRLNGKVESMTRKIQSLQTKLAAVTVQPSQTTPAAFVAPRPKTPSPVLSSIPSAGPSARPATRIPSSPGAALRARTPEPSRKQHPSRFATPEPPIPVLPQAFRVKTPERQAAPRSVSRMEQPRGMNSLPSTSHVTPPKAPSTPLSSGSRKRRAPDDFDSPAPALTEAVVAPSLNLTPRRIRRPTNEGRSGFTPTRNVNAVPTRPAVVQQSPLRRVTAPLSETTNSPRGSRSGQGKPLIVSKPPMRSWLSRSRPPTGVDLRSTSALGVQP